MKQNGFLTVGKIVGTHGVRGMLKVHSYAESAEIFRLEDTVVLTDPSGGKQRVTFDTVKPHKRGLLVSLASIKNRDQARALVGSSLKVPRSSLPPVEEGTYYWADLIGLAVYTADREYLGVLERVMPTGSNDVYVIRDNGSEVLVPALATVVSAVDLERRMMTVKLPEGL